MKKNVLLSLLLCGLWLVPFAGAEVVYLKNGTVMKGRIVGKNDTTIILQSGDDPQTRSTIFLSDINKMMTDEEFEKQSLSASLDVLKSSTWIPPSFENGPVLPDASGEDPASHIQSLVRSQQEYLVRQAKEQMAQQSPESEKDPLRLMTERERKRTQSEEVRIERLRSLPKEGKGEFSGKVILPKLPEARGDLYVYVMEDAGKGKFISADKMLFQKIDASEITSNEVPYTIKNIPSGTYKIFAQWDLSKPDVSVAVTADKVALEFLGTQGDYTGFTRDTVSLGIDEMKEGVDFACTTYIDKDKTRFDWGKRPAFRIKDIYYLKSHPEDRFYIIIQNLSPKPIDNLPLDISINDKKIFAYAWQLKDIPAEGEKEFDISTAYRGYQKLTQGQSGKALKFKVTFAGSAETEFEKILYVF